MLSVNQRKPVRRDDVWLRQTNGENAIYNRSKGVLHLLNETALSIWELCDGDTSPQEMVEAICELFNSHPDVVAEDVDRVLKDFAAADLIRWVE